MLHIISETWPCYFLKESEFLLWCSQVRVYICNLHICSLPAPSLHSSIIVPYKYKVVHGAVPVIHYIPSNWEQWSGFTVPDLVLVIPHTRLLHIWKHALIEQKIIKIPGCLWISYYKFISFFIKNSVFIHIYLHRCIRALLSIAFFFTCH